jgi:Ras GTPase-activating-like protein IQGAP2/3
MCTQANRNLLSVVFHIQLYSNLFFLLQSEPRHIASLCRLVSLSEIDTLLQTVMFTLYGNQYESREEHLLLTMFQASLVTSEHDLSLISLDVHQQSVLSAQFETATDFGSLLRANTPVSRMMTTYTRRGPGQSYLKSVLADRINSLIEHKDLNLEINPLKVYEQMITQIEDETGSLPEELPRAVSPEVASANQDVQNIIAPRLTMLMEIAKSFLLTIMESLESVPYGIRWICKQIRSLTKVGSFLSWLKHVRATSGLQLILYDLAFLPYVTSANTLKLRTMQSAPSSAGSSSFALSIPPS